MLCFWTLGLNFLAINYPPPPFTQCQPLHSYISEKIVSSFSFIKSIPKSQFIIIRRIRTSLNDYWSNAKQYVRYFVATGFKESTLIDNAKAVSKLERQQLLNPVSSSAETCKYLHTVCTHLAS